MNKLEELKNEQQKLFTKINNLAQDQKIVLSTAIAKLQPTANKDKNVFNKIINDKETLIKSYIIESFNKYDNKRCGNVLNIFNELLKSSRHYYLTISDNDAKEIVVKNHLEYYISPEIENILQLNLER